MLLPKTSPWSMRSGQVQMHRLSLWRPRSYNFDSSCTMSTKSSMLRVKDNGIGLRKKMVIAELSKTWKPLFVRTSRRSRSAGAGTGGGIVFCSLRPLVSGGCKQRLCFLQEQGLAARKERAAAEKAWLLHCFLVAKSWRNVQP